MGSYVEFRCANCGYQEAQLPVGTGRDADKELKLFACNCCKSVHSTWVVGENAPRCSLCYDRDIRIIEAAPQSLDCPKCGNTAALVSADGSWD